MAEYVKELAIKCRIDSTYLKDSDRSFAFANLEDGLHECFHKMRNVLCTYHGIFLRTFFRGFQNQQQQMEQEMILDLD